MLKLLLLLIIFFVNYAQSMEVPLKKPKVYCPENTNSLQGAIWAYNQTNTPRAIPGPHAQAIKDFINQGADPNIEWAQSTTLSAAVLAQDEDLVQFLLDNGADVHIKSGSCTPIIAAWQSYSITKLLLDKGANPNDMDLFHEEMTPLLLSIWNGKNDVAQLLIERGAGINISNAAGNTPLILATLRQAHALVELLLWYGADQTANGNCGTALDIAKKDRCHNIIKILDNLKKTRLA